MWMLSVALVVSLLGTSLLAGTPPESLHLATGGDSPQVVLIPDLSGCEFGFRQVVAGLESGGISWAVVEPLAVGRSPRPAVADYSLTAQADRVAAVIQQLGEPPTVAVGHGVSGSIVLRLALRRQPDSRRHSARLAAQLFESADQRTGRQQ